MRHLEDKLQEAVMQHLALVLPDVLAWHTPNGGKRNPREAGRLKRMGVTPGIPDVLLIYEGRLYAIELKVGKNALTDAQLGIRDRLTAAGAAWECCRSLSEVEDVLCRWGLPMRGRIAA